VSPKKRIISHDLDLEPVRKLLFCSATIDNIDLVDRTSSGVGHFRPRLSKDIPVAEGIPTTEDIPAIGDIPATEDILTAQNTPATQAGPTSGL
jgi:hypothetical protein